MLDFKMSNLAVVGAGIGGCSAAYFARKTLPGIKLTIYDAQDRIGGRILTYNADGRLLERHPLGRRLRTEETRPRRSV